MIAARAEDSQVRDHALAWPDHRDRFLLGGEEAVLIQPLEWLQLMAFAEEAFEVILRYVGVAGR